MDIRLGSAAVAAAMLWGTGALAAPGSFPCANPNALGVSRVITIDARRTPAIGSHDYGITLPLAAREVVLTFDDGPRSPYTDAVLRALANECIKATFFMLGHEARANPGLAREVLAAGHTIGTHTQNHPMHRMSPQLAKAEIETGIDSVGNAVGRRSLAPFFRFPGLYRTWHAEQYLRSRGIMAWSIDIDSYDYRRSSGPFMLNRLMSNLERRGSGILLMHDMQPKTALMLPSLLARLKARGFRVVHVVPSGSSIVPELVADARERPPAGALRVRQRGRANVRVARSPQTKASFAEIFAPGFRR
jgi:peptidoglycan/xylan/chitin deacetylase (PgdA/CDA1 family)